MAKNFPLSLYYSVTTGAVPQVTDLDRGTPAFNIVDKKMFMRVTTEANAATPENDTLFTFDLNGDFNLEALKDVEIANTTNGQALVFDGGKWKNITVTSSIISDFVEKVKEIAGITDDTGIVHTKGDESIEGVKTFAVAPKISAAQTVESDAEEVAKVGIVKTQTVYTDISENGSTVAIGGIPKGKKYENANVVDIINDLLHPYVGPSGVSISLNETGGTFEFGVTKNVTSGTVRWTNGSTKVVKAEILVGSEVKGTADVAGVATSQAVTLTAPMEVKTNTTFTARVTEVGGKTANGGNAAFSFVYPMYYGVVANGAALDGATIAGLTKQVVGKGNKTFSYTTSGAQQVVFAYPKSYGTLKSVLDPNNFETIDTFTKTEVAVTGLDTTEQTYNVYAVTTNVQAFAYTFKF